MEREGDWEEKAGPEAWVRLRQWGLFGAFVEGTGIVSDSPCWRLKAEAGRSLGTVRHDGNPSDRSGPGGKPDDGDCLPCRICSKCSGC